VKAVLVAAVLAASFATAPATARPPSNDWGRSRVVPAGDVNGDGTGDLAYVQTSALTTVVEVRDGRDGELLWDVAAGDEWPDPRVPVFAPVGPRGEPGMLLLARSGAPLAAFGRDGAQLWRVDAARAEQFEGAVSDSTREGRWGRDEPLLGDLSPGPAVDTLVTTSVEETAGSVYDPGTVRVFAVSIVNGADGSVRDLAHPFVSTGSRVVVAVAPDLDRDGLADVLVGTWAGSRALLTAVSSATGLVLWERHDLGTAYSLRAAYALGDVTGDGVGEVAAHWYDDIGRNDDGVVALFDGATGATLWVKPGTSAVSVATGRAGRVVVASPGGPRVTAYDAAGRAAWSVSPPMWPRRNGYDPITVRLAGDAQGDGVADVAYGVPRGDWGDPDRDDVSDGLIDGRTGRLLAARANGATVSAVDGPIDGRGTDVLRTTVAGRRVTVEARRGGDGRPLWRTAFDLRAGERVEYAYQAPGAAGRCAPVVVGIVHPGNSQWSPRAVVLSGADGAPRWGVEQRGSDIVTTPPVAARRRTFARSC
jgi:hypothetical protein